MASKLLQQNWKISAPLFLILALGVFTLFSTGIGNASDLKEINNQIAFIVIGLAIYLGLIFFDYTLLKFIPLQIIIAVGTVLPLILLPFFGTERNNATRWFDLGFGTLQPSEFAKVALAIIIAFILTQLDKLPEWARGALAIGSGLFVAALIIIQPNLSTTLIVLGITAITFLTYTKSQGYWFIAFVNVVLLILTLTGVIFLDLIDPLMVDLGFVQIDFLLLGIILLVNFFLVLKFNKLMIFSVVSVIAAIVLLSTSAFVWNNVLAGYQKTRIESFLGTGENAQAQNFQVEQAKIAIGSGQLLGKGFGQGSQSNLNFLPEHKTDFIFAAYSEQFGWVGAMILLSLYLFMVISVINVALKTNDTFGYVICIGIASMILLETFVNVGVNLGILPATGIALPLFSLGGSSIIAKLAGLGLVQSIWINSSHLKGERSILGGVN